MDDAIMYVNLPRQNNRRSESYYDLLRQLAAQIKKKTYIGAYIKLQQEMTV